jgi:hypothetical protein
MLVNPIAMALIAFGFMLDGSLLGIRCQRAVSETDIDAASRR